MFQILWYLLKIAFQYWWKVKEIHLFLYVSPFFLYLCPYKDKKIVILLRKQDDLVIFIKMVLAEILHGEPCMGRLPVFIDSDVLKKRNSALKGEG